MTQDDLLLQGAEKGNTQQVLDALGAGAHVNAVDSFGHTALIWAVFGGYDEIITALLNTKNINVNAATKKGNTALMKAAVTNRAPIAQLLLNHGADRHATNLDGKTAMIEAENAGHQDIIDLLKKCP